MYVPVFSAVNMPIREKVYSIFAIVSLVLFFAAFGCGGGGSGDSSSSGNPTQMSNLDNGVYVDENSEVCYNGENLVISADFTDADGIDKVYGKIGTNDWVEATTSGDNYSISFPAAHYDNAAGLKTIDILAHDNKGNDYETQVNGYVYGNETETDSWLQEIVEAKKPDPVDSTIYNQILNDEAIDANIYCLSSDRDYVRVIGQDSDQDISGFPPPPEGYVLTPVLSKNELESDFNNTVNLND